jgi:hypothetical protein
MIIRAFFMTGIPSITQCCFESRDSHSLIITEGLVVALTAYAVLHRARGKNKQAKDLEPMCRKIKEKIVRLFLMSFSYKGWFYGRRESRKAVFPGSHRR